MTFPLPEGEGVLYAAVRQTGAADIKLTAGAVPRAEVRLSLRMSAMHPEELPQGLSAERMERRIEALLTERLQRLFAACRALRNGCVRVWTHRGAAVPERGGLGGVRLGERLLPHGGRLPRGRVAGGERIPRAAQVGGERLDRVLPCLCGGGAVRRAVCRPCPARAAAGRGGLERAACAAAGPLHRAAADRALNRGGRRFFHILLHFLPRRRARRRRLAAFFSGILTRNVIQYA